MPVSTSRLICTTGSSCCSTIQTGRPLLNWRFRMTGVQSVASAGSRIAVAPRACPAATATGDQGSEHGCSCVRAVQFSVHSESDVTSLTKIRLPETAGWAHVALSATAYRFKRFEPVAAAPRHNQLGVVVQQEEKTAGLDDGGIRGLTGLTEPEHLAGVRVEREELASRLLGQAEQGIADEHRIAQEQRDLRRSPTRRRRPTCRRVWSASAR